jgi:hypothetical protein
MSLFVLASVMANPALENICYAIAVILVASFLLMNAVFHGIQASREPGGSSAAVYFIAFASSVACWLTFWLIEQASMEIRLLSLFAGMLGLFRSLWYIRLAFRVQASNRKAAMLCILAATTSYLGIVVATQSHVSAMASITEVACYIAFVGVQILLTAIYLFRECGAVEESPIEPSAAANAVDTPEKPTVLVLQ